MPHIRIVNRSGFESSGVHSINELSIESNVVGLTYRAVPCSDQLQVNGDFNCLYLFDIFRGKNCTSLVGLAG